MTCWKSYIGKIKWTFYFFLYDNSCPKSQLRRLLCLLSLKKKHSLSSSSSICFKILSQALLLQQSNCHLCLLSQSSTSTWFMQSCWGWIDIYVLKRSYWSVNSSPNLLNLHAQAPRKRYVYICWVKTSQFMYCAIVHKLLFERLLNFAKKCFNQVSLCWA